MDKRWIVPIALIACAVFWWWTRQHCSDVMPYRGQSIKLSKPYADFDEYKNDPNNIHPSETARVQKLVIEAPIAHSFTSLLDAVRATQEIVFPGYGSGSFGGPLQPDGTGLFVILVEVPRAGKDRFFLFRGHNQRYVLIDDFLHDELPFPYGIREENGFYIFYDQNGKELFRRLEGGAN